MAASDQPFKLNNEQEEQQQLEMFLNALAKAMKAMNFYPPEHPQRDESLALVYAQLSALAGEDGVVLLWSRDACAVAERDSLKSRSATARTLAREMLTRKLQKLVVLPRFSLPDLKLFLSVITRDPAAIYEGGGIEAEMARAGITTIGANEVDLSLLGGVAEEEEQEAEDTPETSAVPDESEQEEEENPEEEAEPLDIQFSVLGIDILLGMLKAETKESQFFQLVREIIEAVDELKRVEAFDSLLPVFDALLDVYETETRPSSQREFLRYSLEQMIGGGAMTNYLLDRIEERSEENEKILDRLCATIGQALAYPLIQRLCITESLNARKTIALAITLSGGAAVPALIAMLKDERWYVVRNMVAILGEIGSPDAIPPLQAVAHHPEPKVRKEIIKALVKLNPKTTEQTLISLIADVDEEVVRQAIYSLGVSRSRAAVRPLLDIVRAPDAMLKGLPLKKHAVAAIGRIGDRQATSPLMDILTTKGWLAPGRWQELKIAAAAALGQLGDDTALPLLNKLARRNTPLGNACGDAADNLERLVK